MKQLPPSASLLMLVCLALVLSSCGDSKTPQLQADLAKAKEDQARAEGQLAQIKTDSAATAASYESTIAAQKAQIETLKQQLKDSTSALTTLQAQIATNQTQQAQQEAQKKEDLRQQSFGKAIEVLKGIRSRIAVGMNRSDYLALVRDANASISSDLESQGIDISQFTVPKDWPATLSTDLGSSILTSLQAYKDVMVLDAATAPDKFLPPPENETQYVLKKDLVEMMDRWSLPILLKGKFQIYDVPLQDQSIGFFSKKTIEKYDISELHTAKRVGGGALVMWSNGGDDVRQMLFEIASKATDASSQLLKNPPQVPPTGATATPPPAPSDK